MKRKIITGLAVAGMVVLCADAATIRYKQSGNWTFTTNDTANAYGWQLPGTLPTSADTVRANWGGNTIVLDSTQTVGKFELGVDDSGTLHVQNGGNLTNTLTNVTIGNNLPSSDVRDVTGTLNIDSGGVVYAAGVLKMASGASATKTKTLTGIASISGTLDIASHLWMGSGDSVRSIAIMDINNGGVVNVGGNIGLGTGNASTASGGVATLNVNNGGTLNLFQWSTTTSIQDGSVLNINEGGTVIVGGNRVSQANAYFALGKIATDLDGIEAVFDSDLNQTTIVAIPEPATIGLLAAFGGGLLLIRRRFMI
ncbi:hypothetical protein PDESU_01365 [Pontiella desulfatans]|uniref:PEP-CTERM protein-sorting domain-containing protein n=1 Tax=Pontiella desulfatans TaxID=2750659 RepID=A0A6C2TZM9_PONDE|nr:PEP-CTERM sorting domain-containing protein [Pontiella desulfatans]VGO12811.1 hypothetical protein PDESU_01365 [Pontiella desulfatans]